MIHVGTDVTKDKHDRLIINSDREILFHTFTIPNNREGLSALFQRIESVSDDFTGVRVGLGATGHYGYNLLGPLLDGGLPTYVISPLYINLYRRSLTLRKMETGKVDSCTIATIIMSGMNLKSCSDIFYHSEELKSLTCYRSDKVGERAKFKASTSGLINIPFPELERLVPSPYFLSVCALFSEPLGAAQIATSHLTELINFLSQAPKGRYGKETAVLFRETARSSVGPVMSVRPPEPEHTIELTQELTAEINEIEVIIKQIMDEEIHSPILTIPGISYRMDVMTLAEIGDFNRFGSADQMLAYAGMSPSTYQSGQLNSCYSHMEKRGSRYLRYVPYNATKHVCQWDEFFGAYFAKRGSKGRHCNAALPHIIKKFVRLVFVMEKSGRTYQPAAQLTL